MVSVSTQKFIDISGKLKLLNHRIERILTPNFIPIAKKPNLFRNIKKQFFLQISNYTMHAWIYIFGFVIHLIFFLKKISAKTVCDILESISSFIPNDAMV